MPLKTRHKIFVFGNSYCYLVTYYVTVMTVMEEQPDGRRKEGRPGKTYVVGIVGLGGLGVT